jgi:hypothetical protein|tara:strand:- start:333 stop:530 length:198 start_codon:yes stop_codon:yes gene_type:complete
MTETVIKKVSGDATYFTEQEFGSVEDAYANRNPLTEAKATVSDIRVNNTKYRLKKNEGNIHRTRY